MREFLSNNTWVAVSTPPRSWCLNTILQEKEPGSSEKRLIAGIFRSKHRKSCGAKSEELLTETLKHIKRTQELT